MGIRGWALLARLGRYHRTDPLRIPGASIWMQGRPQASGAVRRRSTTVSILSLERPPPVLSLSLFLARSAEGSRVAVRRRCTAGRTFSLFSHFDRLTTTICSLSLSLSLTRSAAGSRGACRSSRRSGPSAAAPPAPPARAGPSDPPWNRGMGTLRLGLTDSDRHGSTRIDSDRRSFDSEFD